MKIAIIALVIVLIGVCMELYPFFYWLENDTLTGMQVFKRCWFWLFGGILMCSAGSALVKTFKGL